MKRGFIRRNPNQRQSEYRNNEIVTQTVYCTTCHEKTPHTVQVGDYVDTPVCDYCGGKSKVQK